MDKDKSLLDEVFDVNKPPTVKEILKQVVAGQSEISKKLTEIEDNQKKKLTEIENHQKEYLHRLEKLERFYLLFTFFVTKVKLQISFGFAGTRCVVIILWKDWCPSDEAKYEVKE